MYIERMREMRFDWTVITCASGSILDLHKVDSDLDVALEESNQRDFDNQLSL